MLTHEQKEALKKQLQEEHARLSLELTKDNPNVDFGSDVDAGDEESDETEEYANRLGTNAVTKERLSEIERALSKMDKDTYGSCEECAGLISFEVLSIDPESRLCKSCKMK